MGEQDYQIVKKSIIKKYLKEEKNIRSSREAVDLIALRIDKLIIDLLEVSIKIAYENKRKTIMEEDITKAISKVVAREDLDWDEIAEQILKETPADLSKISKVILKEIGE